ncbi:hypothetical protein ZOSMA_59G00540 [Zostera marina]|uniref:tRNA(adenine(34)) deaminase n=1 Tax=Zostera marina TaxID=29655 RepID=A0A0K9NV30_ZOSMR|nr:hypothetical protein ZOSMA_59G00540 [Zostera marina]
MHSDYAYPSALSQSAIPRRRITNSGTISIGAINSVNESCRSVTIHGVVVSVNPWEIYRNFYWRQSALIHCPPPPLPLCRVRPLVSSAVDRSTVGSGYCRIGLRNSPCCCCCNGGGEVGADRRFDKIARFLTEVKEFRRPLSRKNSSLKYGPDSAEAEMESGVSDEEDNRRREVEDFSSNGIARFAEVDGDFRERQSVLSSDLGKRSDMSSELGDLDTSEIQQPEKTGKYKKEKRKPVLLDLASSGAKQEEQEQLVKEENRRSRKETRRIARSSSSSPKVVEKKNDVSRSSSKMVEKNDDASSLSLNLLKEEVERQRSEINQLNENYQKLLLQRVEEEHDDANIRIMSMSDMLCSRIEDRESSLSNSIGDLVEELRNQRVEIANLIRRDRDREVIKSLEIQKIDRERIENSNQVFISSSLEREQQSTTVNQARKDDQRTTESSEKESDVLAYSGQNKKEEISSSVVVNSKDVAKEEEIYSYTDQYRKHYGMLMESSEVDNAKVSNLSNKMMAESSKEEVCSTSTSNLVEKKQQESFGYKTDNQMLTISTISSQKERLSKSNKMKITSSEDREESSSSTSNLVEKKQQESFACKFKTDNQMLTKSTISSQKERLSKSNKMKITSPEDREESSSSTRNLAEERKQQQNFACQSLSDIEKEKPSSLNTMVVTSSEGREERSTSSSNFIDEIKQQEMKYGVKFSKSSETQKKSNLNDDVSVSNLRYGEKISKSAVNVINESTDQLRSNESIAQEERQQIEMARASILQKTIVSKASASLEDVEKSDAILKEVGKKEWEHQKTIESEIYNSSLKYNETPKMEEHITSGGVASGSGSIIYQDYQHTDEHGINDDLYRINHDVLESVIRLEQASAQYVGEFSNKLREEMQSSSSHASASQHFSDTNREITSISQQTSIVDETVDVQIQLQKTSPDQSSTSSEKKGPSDEIWDVMEPSLESQVQIEGLGREISDEAVESTMAPANSESVITKRSGRSLWTFAADLLKMNWTFQTGPQKLAPQSRTRRSSDESANSDVWFSGHEHDEEEDRNVEKRGKYTSKEPDLNKSPTDQQISGIQVKKLQKVEGSHFLGSNKAETSSVLPSIIIGSSSQLPSTEMQNIGIKKSEWKDVGIEKAEVIDAGLIEGDVLRRRKFQRNKQILRENVDEWEDVHKLESMQRNADEFFMREALLEAKMAAETWEVPIGAVLVQNSTIIARGRNLVEELRDSTAHAELICIREASNVLQNWRLSDTTLYVTLEPCPMCAGAILQARIDTVVWGAPNKLLGADGSWVRLFPDGEDNDDRRDTFGQSSEMASGPVHPFHPKITIRRGILAKECAEMMQQLFQLRRKQKKIKQEEENQAATLTSSHRTKFFTRIHNMFSMIFCL